jgi:hypothetical protein
MAKKSSKAKPQKKRKRQAAKKNRTKAAPAIANVTRLTAETYAHAERVFELHKKRLFKLDDSITSVSLGYRYKNDQYTGEIAIRLHFETQKAKESLLARAKREEVDLQPDYDGVPIDLVVSDFRCTASPIQDSSEITSDIGDGGALATTVARSSGWLWLTSAHVVSRALKPTSSAKISESSNGFIGIVPQGSIYYVRDRLADAAIIIPVDDQLVLVPAQGRLSRRATAADIIDEVEVEMRGPKTHSKGFIESITNFNIPMSDGTFADNHIIMFREDGAPFAAPGDSGSLLLIGSTIVGLVRGTDFNKAKSLACQIDDVERALGFEYDL